MIHIKKERGVKISKKGRCITTYFNISSQIDIHGALADGD